MQGYYFIILFTKHIFNDKMGASRFNVNALEKVLIKSLHPEKYSLLKRCKSFGI